MDLLFADNGDVVFRLAGEHAVVAADAGVEVDGHAPGVGFFFIWIVRIEREVVGRFVFFGEVRLFAIFGERGFADQGAMAAVGRVHRLHALGGGEFVGGAGLFDCDPCGCPGGGGGAQSVGVEALGGADAAGAGTSVAERDGDGVVGMAGLNPDGAGDFFGFHRR